MPPNDYVHITCDNQTSEGSCVSGPGDYCEGHPESKSCRLFLVRNGLGYAPVWASDMKNARAVMDIGRNKRKIASSIEGVIDVSGIINDKSLVIKIAKRNNLKPEDLVN